MGGFFRTEGTRLIRECRNETLWIEPWGANSLRVRGTKRAAIDVEQDWALLHKSGNDAAEGRMLDAGSSAEVCMPDGGSSAEVRISDDGRSAEIRNGKITAKISPNGKITYYNTGGRLLLEEYVRSRDNLKEFVSALCINPREYLPVPGTNDFRLTVRFEADDDENCSAWDNTSSPTSISRAAR